MSEEVEKDSKLTIVIGKKRIVIPEKWIPRWQMLIDFSSDMGKVDIPWKTEEMEEVLVWVSLNKMMNKKILVEGRPAGTYENIELTQCWNVVQYMNPVDSVYLMYCHISINLPIDTRRVLYEGLGRHIRTGGKRMAYTKEPTNKHLQYNNLNLHEDPAYERKVIKTGRYGYKLDIKLHHPGVRKKILDADLNVVTGIIHTAYYKTQSKEKEIDRKELCHSDILPSVINWNDIAYFGYDYPNLSINAYKCIYRILADLEVYKFTMSSATLTNNISELCENRYHPVDDSYKAVDKAVFDYIQNEFKTFIKSTLTISKFVSVGDRYHYADYRVSLCYKDGIVRVLDDNFPLLLDQMCKYMDKVENAKQFCLKIEFLFYGLFKTGNPDNKIANVDLMTAIAVLCRATWYVGSRVVVESREYGTICDRIVSTLGSRMLASLVKILLFYVDDCPEKMEEDRILKSRMVKFAEASFAVLEKVSSTGFQTWPRLCKDLTCV